LLWSATARRALEEGHQVATLTHRWPSPPEAIRDLQARGAQVFFRVENWDRRAVRLAEQFLYPLPSVARWKPDVLCFSQGSSYEIAVNNDAGQFQRKCGVPFVVVCQYNSDAEIPAPDIRARSIPFFQSAFRVVFVSDHNRRSLERHLAVSVPNSCVVCNPVNLPGLEEVPWPELPVPHMACVARLDASVKGQDVLFEVLSQPIWKDRPWRLRLCGAGKDDAYLRALADHFGISSRVDFSGHVASVREIWADNHILVLPSRSEGTPLALLEAMISGRPAVVTDVGGNLEWIDEPEIGFIAEAPTVKSFGAALERAWQARRRWPALGTRAHDKALRKLDPSPEKTLLSLLVDAGRSARLRR
jgi:glycosyltransferase involved in cell wall biosynthesis